MRRVQFRSAVGRRPILLLTACVLVVASACSSSGKGTPPTSSTSTGPSSSTSTSTSIATPVSGRVTVFFVAHEHVAAAGRDVTPATPTAAVRALLAGPRGDVEHKLGFASAIPTGTALHSVTVAGGAATVDLSRQFASGGGSLSMQERVAQVVFTVTQFPKVERVRFRLDGAAVSTIGGEGLIVNNVTRATFTNVTPLILVESPTPGQHVRSPVHARGMSNTFEATVNYTLTDPSGALLTEGHTTATAGSGTWGRFNFDVAFHSRRSGLGHLIAYEISPKDGSHVNVTSIPVLLP